MLYLSLDCETGGLDPEECSLLTTGLMIVSEDFKEVARDVLATKPNDGLYRVYGSSMGINRIDLVEHDRNALTYREAGNLLYRMLKGWSKDGSQKLTVLGKNVEFDLRFIWQHLMSRDTWEQFCSYRVFDLTSVVTYLQAKGKIPRELGSLIELAEYFKVPFPEELHHNALADAEVTYRVMGEALKL